MRPKFRFCFISHDSEKLAKNGNPVDIIRSLDIEIIFWHGVLCASEIEVGCWNWNAKIPGRMFAPLHITKSSLNVKNFTSLDKGISPSWAFLRWTKLGKTSTYSRTYQTWPLICFPEAEGCCFPDQARNNAETITASIGSFAYHLFSVAWSFLLAVVIS